MFFKDMKAIFCAEGDIKIKEKLFLLYHFQNWILQSLSLFSMRPQSMKTPNGKSTQKKVHSLLMSFKKIILFSTKTECQKPN